MASVPWILALSVLVSVAVHPSWSPISPTAYSPSQAPKLQGPLSPLPKLLEARKLYAGEVNGPEDVISDAEGNLFCSNGDGRILKLWRNGSVSTWARVGGRPLGITWLVEGESMVVCEPFQGLLLVNSDDHTEVLSTEADGVKFRLVDNAVIASDGSIYFTDASSSFGLHQYVWDVLEARPHGRLLKYSPATRSTETVLSGLYFANGLALSKDEDFVLIVETPRYRIRRFFLKGPKAGSDDIFMDNLPGFPDNINLAHDGLFWVGLVLPRQPIFDILHNFPTVKALLPRLPTSLWLHFEETGLAMGVSKEGRVEQFFSDVNGSFYKRVTNVQRFGDQLVLGSLSENSVLVLDLKLEK